MPKVTDEYRDARRAQIAEAAMRAFARTGFSATSMADIIAESGLSAGAIYGHFKGKADIVRDVAERIVGARLIDIDALLRQAPMPAPGEALTRVVRSLGQELPSTGILVQLWGEAVTDPALRALTGGVIERMREGVRIYIEAWLVREYGLSPAEAAARAEEQAPVFIAVSQGFILQSALAPDFDAEGYLAAAVRMLPR